MSRVLQLRAARAVLSLVAMEHTCHVCGRALGRVLAPLDPIYKLPVVVCPGCGVACVRRRHPLGTGWRAFQRMRATVAGLAWRVFVAASMVAITIGLAAMVSETWRGISLWELLKDVRAGGPEPETIASWRENFGPAIAGVAGAWSVAAGATLAAGLGHVRRRWMVWGALIAAVTGVMLMEGAQNYVNHAWRMLPTQEDHGAGFWVDCETLRRVDRKVQLLLQR